MLRRKGMIVKSGAMKILSRFALNETGFKYVPSACYQVLPEVQKLVDKFLGTTMGYEDKKSVLQLAEGLRELPPPCWDQNKVIARNLLL